VAVPLPISYVAVSVLSVVHRNAGQLAVNTEGSGQHKFGGSFREVPAAGAEAASQVAGGAVTRLAMLAAAVMVVEQRSTRAFGYQAVNGSALDSLNLGGSI
jgi:hypothetical protein